MLIDTLIYSISNFLSFYCFISFFFNDTATTEIYTLSLHDALPISPFLFGAVVHAAHHQAGLVLLPADEGQALRSEEHTSELQSHVNLVCRLLLEKKKNCTFNNNPPTSKHCANSPLPETTLSQSPSR